MRHPKSGASAANLCFQPCKPMGEVTGSLRHPFAFAGLGLILLGLVFVGMGSLTYLAVWKLSRYGTEF